MMIRLLFALVCVTCWVAVTAVPTTTELKSPADDISQLSIEKNPLEPTKDLANQPTERIFVFGFLGSAVWFFLFTKIALLLPSYLPLFVCKSILLFILFSPILVPLAII